MTPTVKLIKHPSPDIIVFVCVCGENTLDLFP